MSRGAETITPDAQPLLAELGTLGIAELMVSPVSEGRTSILAHAPVNRQELGSDHYDGQGNMRLYLGYGRRGFPFAYHGVSNLPDATRRHVVASEWDPSLVATDRTWDILKQLNNPTMDELVYVLDVPAPEKPKRLRSISRLFGNTVEEQIAAAALEEKIAQVRENGIHRLTIQHVGGLATGHRTTVEWRDPETPPGQPFSGSAVDQAGSHFYRESWVGAHDYKPAIALPARPGEKEYGLEAINDLTFNRMPPNSVIKFDWSRQ